MKKWEWTEDKIDRAIELMNLTGTKAEEERAFLRRAGREEPKRSPLVRWAVIVLCAGLMFGAQIVWRNTQGQQQPKQSPVATPTPTPGK